MYNTARRRSTQDKHTAEVALRNRVKELENEVITLKRRLDELRKAKNTTVLKREREVLEVGVPFRKREQKRGAEDDAARVNELQEKLSELQHSRDAELSEIRKTFAAEIDELRRQNVKDNDNSEDTTAVRRRLEEVEADNAALVVENSECKKRIEALVTELSEKEVRWCDTEEKYKLELKASWGSKYAEWMSATEKKIRDLQATNEILRGYLKMQQPGGHDPSGQDP